LGIGLRGGVVWVSGEGSGWYGQGGWGVEVGRAELRYEGEGAYPRVVFKGRADAKGVAVSIEELRFAEQNLYGKIDAKYSLEKNSFTELYAQYELYSYDIKRFEINGTAKLADGQIESQIYGKNIPIEEIVAANGSIKGDMEIRASGSIRMDEPFSEASFSISNAIVKTSKGEIGGIPFVASLQFEYNYPAIRITRADFSYQGQKIENLQLDYEVSTSRIAFESTIKSVVLEKLFAGKLSGKGTIALPAKDRPYAEMELNGALTNITYNTVYSPDVRYSAAINQNAVTLSLQRDDGALAEFDKDSTGKFKFAISKFLGLVAEAKGTLSGKNIEAEIGIKEAVLGTIARLIDLGPIKELKGTIAGSLRLSGDLNDPEIDGAFQLSNAAFSSDLYLLENAGPFNTNISIEKGSIVFEPAIVPIGAGKVSLAASATLRGWNIGDIQLLLSTEGITPLKLRGTVAGLKTAGIDAYADIKAALSPDGISIGGYVLLDNGTVSVNPEGFISIAVPEDAQSPTPLNLDLSVSLGRNTELYLPSEEIPLVRGMAGQGSQLRVQYSEASGAFSLTGKLNLRSGYVLYLLRNFFIRECTIEFAENQVKFDPLITATAEVREPGKEGIILVTLSADRLPLSAFNPRISSIPPMNEAELLVLLGGGLAMTKDSSMDDTLGVREAVIASSDFLVQNALFRSFEQRVQKALGLDVVYLRSSFLQKWLLDITAQKPSGAVLSEYLSGTEFYAGKYLTESAFAHFIVRMSENPLEKTGSLQLDYELGIEFDAPFGLLQWGMTKGNEGTPLNNQKLSLSWRIRY